MRYLGIDYGSRKIGLALSDEAGTMGFPYKIIANTPRLARELAQLVEREGVGAVVIGESRALAGGENPVAQKARSLGDMLQREAQVPVAYESEIYTSVEARRQYERGKSRAPKARAAIDDSAAALILTSYLSRTGHG